MAHQQVTEAGAGVTAGVEVEGARASAPEEQSATDELDKHRTEALSRKYTANARRERLLPWQRGLGAGTADALAVNKCIDYELHRDAVPAEAPAAMGSLAPFSPTYGLGSADLQRQPETQRPAGTGQLPLSSRPFGEPCVVSPLSGKEAEATEIQQVSPTHRTGLWAGFS